MKNSYEHLALLSLHSILAVTIVATDIDEALPGLAQMVPAPQKNRIKRLFLSPSPTHLWDNGKGAWRHSASKHSSGMCCNFQGYWLVT